MGREGHGKRIKKKKVDKQKGSFLSCESAKNIYRPLKIKSVRYFCQETSAPVCVHGRV